MAKKDANKFLKNLYKYVGTQVRKDVAKSYSETTFDVTGVANGIKQGYDSIADRLVKDNAYIEITDEEYKQIGQAGVNAVREYAARERTAPIEITQGEEGGPVVSYLTRRDVTKPHTLCKNAAVKKLNEILQGKGGRALKRKQKDEHASQSEIGMVKAKVHKLHMDKTTVGSARLAAAMDFLSRTRDFAGFANSEAAKDIIGLYAQVEFLWDVGGTKKTGSAVSLKEGQVVSMRVDSQANNPAGGEPFDWKNLSPKFEKAIMEYMLDAGLTDIENSPSIRQNAKKMTAHAVVQALTTGKKVTSNKKTKASYREAQKTVDTNKRTSQSPSVSKKRAKTRRRKAKMSPKGIAAQPLHLIGMLNRELPSTVRKNMTHPNLENRTGRFASSVKIVDINQTPQGYPSIGYTYQKSPYGVFETGTGAPPWADGDRDPRELIDKSIREIAMKFALGRFYTRRL